MGQKNMKAAGRPHRAGPFRTLWALLAVLLIVAAGVGVAGAVLYAGAKMLAR